MEKVKNSIFFMLVAASGFLAVLCTLPSCNKDNGIKPPDAPFPFPLAPKIKFESVAPTTISEYKDSITFQISYRDSDGDLGENNPNISNLFLIDNRINVTYNFRISQLAPDNANITISGNIAVVLPNTGITDNSSSQKADYTIYVKDRAGNTSNFVTSSQITVNK